MKIVKLVKILFVLLTALAVLNCSSNSDDESATVSIIGTWTTCKVINLNSERVTYTFTSSTLTHVRKVFQQASSLVPKCTGNSDADITSQYDITIASSNQPVKLVSGSTVTDTVNGSEIDYNLNSVEAFARTGNGAMLLSILLRVMPSVTQGSTVDLLNIAPQHSLVRPSRGGLYFGVYYIKTSVSPQQLYTKIGASVNTNMSRDLKLKDNEYYKRR